MSYAGFHLTFLAPVIALLLLLLWRDQRACRTAPSWLAHRSGVTAVFAHVVIAVVYTTPWDNYLVATRVWWYDPARVVGVTLGWVPLEEYAFFVLQTIATGSWLLWLMRRRTITGRLPRDPAPGTGRSSPAANGSRAAALVAGILWLACVLPALLGWRPGTYLALAVGWLLPPIALQLAAGGRVLWQLRSLLVPALVVPIVYLALADSVAIAGGIWTIDPAQTTGILLGGVLPVEELIFFVLTNTLIVFGITLLVALPFRLRRPSSGDHTGTFPLSRT